jgi:hypothetical protein
MKPAKNFVEFRNAYDYQISKRKTIRQAVHSTHSGDFLGMIKFYPGWREYVFEPCNATRFSEECLREILERLDILNIARRLEMRKKQ